VFIDQKIQASKIVVLWSIQRE